MTTDEEKIDNIEGILKGYSKVHLWEYQKIKQLEDRISKLEEKLQDKNKAL